MNTLQLLFAGEGAGGWGLAGLCKLTGTNRFQLKLCLLAALAFVPKAVPITIKVGLGFRV
jgi:hypothetical protein